MENVTPLNYYNLEIQGLPGTDMGKGITVLHWNINKYIHLKIHKTRQIPPAPAQQTEPNQNQGNVLQ